MATNLSLNIFEQARLLVAQADREMAELGARFEEAFPLTQQEREELRPCPVDAYDAWRIELAPKGAAPVFLMTPQDARVWGLAVVEKGQKPVQLGTFQAGGGVSESRRRLHAARVVCAIGDWLQKQGGYSSSHGEQLLSVEATVSVEIRKGEARSGESSGGKAPEVRTVEAKVLDGKADAKTIAAVAAAGETAPQPRWLDMLPGAHESAGLQPLPPPKRESRPQVSFTIGKIFGH